MKREYNGLLSSRERKILFIQSFATAYARNSSEYHKRGKMTIFNVFKGYFVIATDWNDVNEKIIAAGRSIHVCHHPHICKRNYALHCFPLCRTYADEFHLKLSTKWNNFYDAMKTIDILNWYFKGWIFTQYSFLCHMLQTKKPSIFIHVDSRFL